MLVFDRPSIFPLILAFLSCSPLYSLPFPFDTIAYCLVDGRKTREYTRYSPALFPPFIVFPDRPLQLTLEPWSPGAGDPRCLLRRRVPRWPGVPWRFPGRRPRLFDRVVFVLAFLRQPCTPCVCTQILLLPLTFCSRAIVFEPSWPLACIKQLVLFYL